MDRFDPALDELLAADADIQVLAGGFEWSEGPVCVPEAGNKFGGYLLFSDIPNNVVMKWQEGQGCRVFLKPAGYTGRVGLRPGKLIGVLMCRLTYVDARQLKNAMNPPREMSVHGGSHDPRQARRRDRCAGPASFCASTRFPQTLCCIGC